MVVVVPTMNRGSALAQAVGRGLQGVEPMAQQQYQRSQLQNALNEAQTVFNDPNASQVDKLFAYKKAYAGLQGMGDRAEASMTPLLMAASGGEQAVRNAPDLYGNQPQAQTRQLPGFGEVNGRPLGQFPSNTGMQQERGLNVPTEKGIGLPPHHTPEEFSRAARRDRLLKDPNFSTVKLLEEDNKRIDEEEARLNLAAKNHAEISNLRTQTQETFRNFAKQRNPSLQDPNNEAVFNEIDSQPIFSSMDDPTKRFNAVNEVYNQYKLAEKNVLETGKRADFQPERYQRTINSLRTTMKPLLEKGQRGLAERMLADNGYGRVEISRIINDLNPQQKNLISKTPSADKYREEKAAFDTVEQYYSPSKRQAEEKKLTMEKDKFLNGWKKSLKEVIKPGGQSSKNRLVFEPGTDLLIVRDDFMKKGGDSNDFNQIVLDLIDKGEIELDTYQQSQLPLLSAHPNSLMGLSQIFWNGVPGYIERQ